MSLGCATGEEAYSIAMAVRETVRGVGPSAVEILALDVSRAALVTGVRGAYPAARAAAVPAPWLAKYLLPRPEGFAVGPALREMVRFRPHDVRRGFYLGKFDVIFACNVLVYFTAAMRRRVLAQLAEAVAPGGYLFLGHAEEVTPPAVYFDPAGAPGVCVYRRNETACDGAAPAPLDAARPLTCSAVETAPADRPLDGD